MFRFSIKAKLLIGFLTTSLITLLVGLIGVITISNLTKNTQELLETDVQLLIDSEILLSYGLTHRILVVIESPIKRIVHWHQAGLKRYPMNEAEP